VNHSDQERIYLNKIKNMKNFTTLLCIVFALWGCHSNQSKLSSGFSYVVHKQGEGAKAKPNDIVLMRIQIRNDTGILVSKLDLSTMPDTLGTKSAKRDPIIEAIQLMREGDSLTISIPVNNEYARVLEPKFEHSKMKYIDLAMHKVSTRAEIDRAIVQVKADLAKAEKRRTKAEAAQLAQYAANQINTVGSTIIKGKADKLQTTASGIKYILHEPGQGPLLQKGDYLRIDYCGAIVKGMEIFDNSFARLNDYTVAIGQSGIIPAWQEVLKLLRTGAKITFFVPSELAYDAVSTEATIPRDLDLIYYMEVNSAFKIPTPLVPMLIK
jgi:FKBP-type peptidyl-prolyl cis-trans isomerase FkpA